MSPDATAKHRFAVVLTRESGEEAVEPASSQRFWLLARRSRVPWWRRLSVILTLLLAWGLMAFVASTQPNRHPRFVKLYEVQHTDGRSRVLSDAAYDEESLSVDLDGAKVVFLGIPGRSGSFDVRPVTVSIWDPAYETQEGRQALAAELRRSAAWRPVAGVMAEMVLAGEQERFTAPWIDIATAKVAMWSMLLMFVGVPIWILAALIAGQLSEIRAARDRVTRS